MHSIGMEVKFMSKNNKKTMNERTHNSYEIYKNNMNSNSNNQNEEISMEFDQTTKDRNQQNQRSTNKRK